MKIIILVLLFLLIIKSGSYEFKHIDEIYLSRFANCTEIEKKTIKCRPEYGTCIARVDTVERIAFCLCISGYDGLRCEKTVLPPLFFLWIRSVVNIMYYQ